MNLPKPDNPVSEWLAAQSDRSYRRGMVRLRWRHFSGMPAPDLAAEHCRLIDLSLQPLLKPSRLADPDRAARRQKPCWLALGAYGSLDLTPFSPARLLLTGSVPDGEAGQIQEATRSRMADMGIDGEVVHLSSRECLRRAQTDMGFCLELLSSRWVGGARSVGSDLHHRLRSTLVKRPVVFLCDLESHYRQVLEGKEGSVYALTAGLESGPGGLWCCRALLQSLKLFAGTDDPVRILRKGGITPREWTQLLEIRERLLQIQTHLHFLAGQPQSDLLGEAGVRTARFLGYHDSRPLPAPELLVRDTLRRKRKLLALFERYLEQNKSAFLKGTEPFKSHYLRLVSQPEQGSEEETPQRWMKIFRLSQMEPEIVQPQMVSRLQSRMHLWPARHWRVPAMHPDFRAILRNKGKVGPTLRQMRDLGFLARYLPEFGRLDCLPGIARGHGHSLDEHTLRALDRLDRVANSTDPGLKDYRGLLERVEDPSILTLGLLLHETGSGGPNEPARNGRPMAVRALRRLNVSPEDLDKVLLLVREQTLLAHVSQRRDLDDPQIVQEVSAVVETTDNLNMLLLHTFADLSSVGETEWSERNRFLLWSLYFRVMDRLMFGQELSGAEHARVAEIQRGVLERLAGELPVDSVLHHFSLLPEKYALYTPLSQIVAHVRLCENLKEQPLVSEWVANPDAGYYELNLSTRDLPGRFAQITGTLTALGIRLLSAQLNTREDGIVIDTFHVSDRGGHLLIDDEGRRRVDQVLTEIILGKTRLEDLLRGQRYEARAEPGGTTFAVAPRVRIDNDISAHSTVIEVQVQDSWGLSYRIAGILAELGLNIISAKLATERDYAFDVFYVQTEEGEKVLDGSRMTHIMERLRLEVKLQAPLSGRIPALDRPG